MVSPDGKGRVWLSTEPSSPITMKTKNSSHSHRPLALLGIPFLLLIPARMPDQPGEPDAPAKGKGRDEAEALINEILGSESRISRAEVAREERFRPRFERQCPGQEQLPEASPDQRRAATTYLQERLRGREVKGPHRSSSFATDAAETEGIQGSRKASSNKSSSPVRAI